MAKVLTQKTIDNLKAAPKRMEVPDAALSGLYFVLQPSGAASWAFRYRVNGRPRKWTIGAYPALSLKEARERDKRGLSQDDPAAAKKAGRRAALEPQTDDLIDKVARDYLAKYARARRPRSVQEITRIVEREIVPAWKGRIITDIRKKDIHAMLDPIEARAPVMANRTFAVIRQFFAWCLERGIIDATPCAGIHKPAEETPRDRVLSDDEIKALWHATGKLSWAFGGAIRVLLLTGARLNEVIGASWDEFDLGANLWRLPAARSKNKRAHIIPLSEMVIDILATLPRIHSTAHFIFTVSGKGPVTGFSDVKRRLDAAMPDMAPWTFHDLRRTCASGMARLGIAPHVIEACLNHRSGVISGIAATYNRHSYEPEKRGALDAWARHLEALITGKPARNVIELAGRAT